MYQYRRVHLWNIPGLWKVIAILSRCGKHMAQTQDLYHWDNSFIKTACIVGLCALRNKIWLVYDRERAIATFQTKKTSIGLHPQKLGTDPQFSGKGVGSYCMQIVEEMAKAEGCTKVYFEVYDKSQHALAFYEHRGYACCGQTSTLKYTELIMEKILE